MVSLSMIASSYVTEEKGRIHSPLSSVYFKYRAGLFILPLFN
jgi:hypothetical protein